MFDTVIRNGKLIDGTGNPWILADVGITDNKIAAVGQIQENLLEGHCWFRYSCGTVLV